jgi:predicted component of type VI protein secretion system
MTRLHLSSDQYSFLAEDPNRAFTIGRLSECQFLVADITVSRRHAEVFCRGTNWSVRDLGSKHGISVNGVAVKTARLNPGDQLRLGGLALTVRLLAEGEAAPPARAPAPALLGTPEAAQVRASLKATGIMRAQPAPPSAPSGAPPSAPPSAAPSAPPADAAKPKSRMQRLRQRRIRR